MSSGHTLLGNRYLSNDQGFLPTHKTRPMHADNNPLGSVLGWAQVVKVSTHVYYNWTQMGDRWSHSHDVAITQFSHSSCLFPQVICHQEVASSADPWLQGCQIEGSHTRVLDLQVFV